GPARRAVHARAGAALRRRNGRESDAPLRLGARPARPIPGHRRGEGARGRRHQLGRLAAAEASGASRVRGRRSMGVTRSTVTVLWLLLAGGGPAWAEDGSAAMRAHVDPATGELVRTPVVPDRTVPSPEQSKSAEGLVEEAA